MPVQTQPAVANNQKTVPSPDKDRLAAIAQISNTVTRPGPLTTEWWTVVLAGAISAALALTGLPGSAAAQVAGIVAPILLALMYALVRSRTKGALAEVLQAIFPQADTPASSSADAQAPSVNGSAA